MDTKIDPTPVAVEADEAFAPVDEEDLSKAEIVAGLRQALKELKAGKGRPAREGIAEIRRRIENDANEG